MLHTGEHLPELEDVMLLSVDMTYQPRNMRVISNEYGVAVRFTCIHGIF